MSEYDETDETGGALRAQLEESLKAKKEALAQVSELKAELRSIQINSVLDAKGINKKVASFIPETITDVSDVAKWLDENADVFSPSTATGTQPSEPVAETSVSDSDVASSKRLQDLSSSAGTPTTVADFEARLAAAVSNDEIQSIMAEAEAYVLSE